MKASFKRMVTLFLLDWKRIFRNRPTYLLMIGLMFIPSLYAWFNIAALWDPYSNTGEIAVAIYSEDETVRVLDQKEVNIGNEIIENLKENDTIGWQFVDSKAALDQGVKSGEFYGGIYLPKDFSADLISFLEGQVKKPKIDYQVNQKINAIAPKITDKSALTIKETISQEFIGTVSETLLGVFNEAGFYLDDHLISLDKISSKILALDDQLATIDQYTEDILGLEKKLPTYEEKLTKANDALAYFPTVNQLGEKIQILNEKFPQLQSSGAIVLTLEEKIPEIENAAEQVRVIDEDFDDLASIMGEAITEAQQGLEIIAQAQEVLPDVQKLAETANQILPILSEEVTKIQEALPQVSSGVGTGIQLIVTISKNIAESSQALSEMFGEHALTPEQKDEIKSALTQLDAQLSSLLQILDSTIGMMEKIQGLTASSALQGIIDTLEEVKGRIPGLQEKIALIHGQIDQWSVVEIQESLNQLSQEASDLANRLSPLTPTAIQEKVAPLLTQLEEALSLAGGVTGRIVDEGLVEQIIELLENTTGTLQQAIVFLEKYQAELPDLKQEIHSANLILNQHLPEITAGITQASDLYQNDLPRLGVKLEQAAKFVEEELPTLEEEVTTTVEGLNEKMPKVASLLSTVTTIIQEDWPSLRRGIQRGAIFIREGKDAIDVKEVIRLLKSDVQSESDFMANPIEIDQVDVYPVPNNGSASAPFYTALCLWVGAVLFSSIASTEFHLGPEEKKRYTKREQFTARMGTFLVVSFFQALIVSLGNHWLLGTYAVSPGYSILFALFVGLTFMMMVYVLVALFGNLGKGAAVIILVLSISGGGGNYPIEMSGKFFQWIHPFLPFTHAVNLLREPVGGIYWANAWSALILLFLFFLAFGLVGYLLYPKVQPMIKKWNEELRKGEILH